MIEKLLQIQNIQPKSNSRINHFNATLPILIQVLKKTKSNHYLLMVGNRLQECKSLKELEIGGRYFALMRHSSIGGLMLSSLKAEPKIPKGVLEFSFEDLKNTFEISKMKDLQEYALEHISHAKSKDEFLSWGFFLLGLQKKILSFWMREGEKESFFQIKKQKEELVFYAFFPHLGEISGKLAKYKDKILLDLKVSYESVAALLREKQNKLIGINELKVSVCEKIAPLFSPAEQLLDLKI